MQLFNCKQWSLNYCTKISRYDFLNMFCQILTFSILSSVLFLSWEFKSAFLLYHKNGKFSMHKIHNFMVICCCCSATYKFITSMPFVPVIGFRFWCSPFLLYLFYMKNELAFVLSHAWFPQSLKSPRKQLLIISASVFSSVYRKTKNDND